MEKEELCDLIGSEWHDVLSVDPGNQYHRGWNQAVFEIHLCAARGVELPGLLDVIASSIFAGSNCDYNRGYNNSLALLAKKLHIIGRSKQQLAREKEKRMRSNSGART